MCSLPQQLMVRVHGDFGAYVELYQTVHVSLILH